MRRCKPLSALGAAPLEHELPTLGAHSYAEAVRLRSAAVVRLKSPLHVQTLLDKRLCGKG